MTNFARAQPNPSFFKFLDVARRVAGTGSLGVDRYAVLIDGKGSPDGNYFLDLKEAFASSLAPRLDFKQPSWQSEGQRIVTIQSRVQAVSMAFLRPVIFNESSYVLRGLQPVEDRVELDGQHRSIGELEHFVTSLGHLIAWGELRSSGQRGSASTDDLNRFWRKSDRSKKLIALAIDCGANVQAQWQQYSKAYDAGMLNTAIRH